MYLKNPNKILSISLSLAIIIVSCSRKSNEKIPLSRITRNTYLDEVIVTGVLESSNSINFFCPSLQTDLTVIYLIPDGSYVKEGETLYILQSIEIENQYSEALKNLETSKSEFNKSKAGLELQYLLLHAQVQIIETTTSIRRLDSVQLKFSTPVRNQVLELQLKQAEIEKQKILKQLVFLKQINASELQKMNLRITQQEKRVESAKEKLDQLTGISKTSGLAIRAEYQRSAEKVKEGDIVWDMMPLIQIPDLSRMDVKLMVNESNYKRIKKNQKVKISIDAIPGLVMTGKVKIKEAMGKPVKRDSKVKVFGITASIDSLIGEPRPGLSATCNIIINEVADTLIIPYVSVFDDDSQKVVYVAKNNYFEKRTIELVINNNNIGIVKSGVMENDYVSLIKPPVSMIKN